MSALDTFVAATLLSGSGFMIGVIYEQRRIEKANDRGRSIIGDEGEKP
jgi:hypothetical protein